ncbi:methyltransferase domain-containing protein [Phycisphaerales bacterium AB-hyl4]|uniref:Methyltransferase domain-containing protein n=1 Tax=Natronomicrosphaera hydrolytica TaxID=3242702 RepID=A0ABV4U1M7_9BACT
MTHNDPTHAGVALDQPNPLADVPPAGSAPVSQRPMIRRIAKRYPGHYLPGYAKGKLRTDPAYAAVWHYLKGSNLPVLDLGCGIGLFEQYIRELGYTGLVVGVDPDESKITAARHATRDLPDLTFNVGSATDAIDFQGHVVILDVLHYLRPEDQQALLHRLAEQVAPGGYCLIRATPRDSSWRYTFSRLEECFVRLIGWMQRPAVAFPTCDEITAPFQQRGYRVHVTPAWGKTPFNSYLFVFQRAAEGDQSG